MCNRLILDSGATKTAWVWLSARKVMLKGETAGLNPYLTDKEDMEAIIGSICCALPMPPNSVDFYGAGCRSAESKGLIADIWAKKLPQATFHIHDDITAVGHALLGQQNGIACVLGTGASSGYYGGMQISHYAPSNGIWLGDEGSGAYLGKRLLQAYLNENLPPDLHQAYEVAFPDRRAAILDAIYRQQRPSAYLGKFAPFLNAHQQHPFVAAILADAFSQFFQHMVCYHRGWETLQVAIAGSTAYFFAPQLKQVAGQYNISLLKIEKGVMEGLIACHS